MDSHIVTACPDKSGHVWFEAHESMESAIAREKAIKEWKPELIEKVNPTWRDFYDEIV
jgi:putative endonuclease